MPKVAKVAKATPKNPLKRELSETTKKRRAISLLKDLSDEQLECKSYRFHAFENVRMFHWKDGTGKGICRVSVCARCDTQRDDYYSRKGDLVDRIYTYPDNYLSVTGHGYLTNDRVMREIFARAEEIAASDGDIPSTARHLALVAADSA